MGCTLWREIELKEAMVVSSKQIWVASATTGGQSVIWTHAVVKGHVRVHGLVVVRVQIDICGSLWLPPSTLKKPWVKQPPEMGWCPRTRYIHV